MVDFRKQLTLFDDYREMLSDGVRMDAYARAIDAVVKPGDVVVDLGAGTGILSLMAARAGAAMVHAIEYSDAIELAKRAAVANGLADRITFHRAMSNEVKLAGRCDLLLSETLGSFGLDENTLEFTIDARERFLHPDARMLPHAIETWLVPVELPAQREKVAFWQDVGGFDYSPALDDLRGRMSLARVQSSHLLSTPQIFSQHDLLTQEDTAAAGRLLFPLQRAAVIDGFAGWFSAELGAGVSIRTAPSDPPTHWQQAFFPLREPIEVIAGDFIELTMRIGARVDHSDNTQLSFDYRCTQLANEAT
jgi:protein arginine N-methyltransferase 1